MILLQHKKLSNFRSVFWQSKVSNKLNHIYNLMQPNEFYDQNSYEFYYHNQHCFTIIITITYKTCIITYGYANWILYVLKFSDIAMYDTLYNTLLMFKTILGVY